MALTLTEYLLRDFIVDRVDATLIEFDATGRVRFRTESHAHFHLVLSGKARIAQEEPRQSAILQPGDFALLPYGAGHGVGNAGARGRARKMDDEHAELLGLR